MISRTESHLAETHPSVHLDESLVAEQEEPTAEITG
jgi:hypothetical protein